MDTDLYFYKIKNSQFSVSWQHLDLNNGLRRLITSCPKPSSSSQDWVAREEQRMLSRMIGSCIKRFMDGIYYSGFLPKYLKINQWKQKSSHWIWHFTLNLYISYFMLKWQICWLLWISCILLGFTAIKLLKIFF